MGDHASLRAWMDSAGLGHLTDRFIAAGVNEQNFPAITIADFDALGVEQTAAGGTGGSGGGGGGGVGARQRLFKLLQVVRTESEREAAHNAQAQATLLAASLSHAQARAHAAAVSSNGTGSHTTSLSERFEGQGGQSHGSRASGALPAGLESFAPNAAPVAESSSSFGLRSFFDTRSRGSRSGAAASSSAGGAAGNVDDSLRASPTSSPPQRTLSSHILHSEREYLTLPLRSNPTVLSPARTFQTPQHKRPPTTQQFEQQQQPALQQLQFHSHEQQQSQSHPYQPQTPTRAAPSAAASAAAVAPFVARPMSPTAKPALVYKYGAALNDSSAPSSGLSAGVAAPPATAATFAAPPSQQQQQQQQARSIAWGSAAASPARPSASASVSLASSPMRPSGPSSLAAAAPVASSALFQARAFSSASASVSASPSPLPSPTHAYHPPPSVAAAAAAALSREQFAAAARAGSVHQHQSNSALTASPISPRSSAALHAAHSALERERERQRAEQREAVHAAPYAPAQRAQFAGAPSASASFALHQQPHLQQQQQPAHHRALFADQPEGRQQQHQQQQSASNLTMRHSSIFTDRAPHSVALTRARSPPPSAASASAFSASSNQTLHPLESGDFLADDEGAALERMLQSDELADADTDAAEEDEEEEDEHFEDDEEEEEDGASASSLSLDDGGGEEGQSDAEFNELLSASALGAFARGGGGSSKIRVAVRTRPLNARELAGGETDVTRVDALSSSVAVHEPKQKVDLTRYVESHTFRFDSAFPASTSNRAVYARMCRPLVGWVMSARGGRASCFAYGQTGAGKTHTLMGPSGGKGEQSGLYVLAARDIFRTLREAQRREADRLAAGLDPPLPRGPTTSLRYAHCAVYCTYYELYSGRLFDLLHARSRLVCRTDAAQTVHVVGLRERRVADVAALLALIAEGNKLRSTGQTGANADSSRSHAVLSISLRQIVSAAAGSALGGAGAGAAASSSSSSAAGGDVDPLAHTSALGSLLHGRPRFRLRTRGKFTFIDLAGSERGADTAASDRRTRLEGAEINKSLLALKECIRALDQGQRHAPFRGSILTQVLKASLTGASRTAMVACVAPGSRSCEHTLNTLRYADRVKQLKRGAKGAAGAAIGSAPASALSLMDARASASASAAAPGASSGSRSARSSASGADAYMPHQGRKNSRITMLPPDMPASARDHLFHSSASSAAASSAAATAAAAVPALAASPARPRAAGALRSSVSAGQLHASPPSARPSRSSVATQPQPAPHGASSSSAGSSSASEQQSQLQQRHQTLCARILEEEEQIVSAHRSAIDSAMAGVKSEMELLRRFDGPDGCTVDEYCVQLRSALQAKQKEVAQLSSALEQFSKHLKEEELLSAACKRQLQLH